MSQEKTDHFDKIISVKFPSKMRRATNSRALIFKFVKTIVHA